ncbi:GntR family transcriptional regulator [Paenibacillus sp. CAA11]|uniref:FadR/GntR family transcriptional regulator n=1 Tax=Paenibacillus sp. CAA11 TaxID=1532905 RepID=UPI000D3C0FE1|nr:FadR/GntR family transcriptional regulator [Paenibacillus sp. CAA11]AWB46201.1 GntR family transcriptional regulator [Paenibacillus sp. CAA11]
MNLQHASKYSLVEQAAGQLQALVESGAWPVGMRIPPEPELAAQLSVSRGTVREAVRALAHAGLLRVRQGDGTYVCADSTLGSALRQRITRSGAAETFEVRYALEQEAARLAAIRKSAADLELMRSCLDQCRKAIRAEDKAAYIRADLEFHRALIAASHNSLLEELYRHMTEALQQFIDVSLEEKGVNLVLQMEAHEQLYTAIQNKDKEEAARAVRLYLQTAWAQIPSPPDTI